MRKLRWILPCASLLAIASTGRAYEVAPYASTNVQMSSTPVAFGHSTGPDVIDCSNEEVLPGSGSGVISSSNCGGGFSQVGGSADTAAVAFMGALAIQSSAQAVDGGGIASAVAIAEFADTVTPSLTGILHIEMTVHGTLDYFNSGPDASSAIAGALLEFFTTDYSKGLAADSWVITNLGVNDRLLSIETPVLTGQTVILYGQLTTQVDVQMAGGTAPSSASSNFFHTARISGVELLDSTGQPIPGAVFQFGSGATYPVPEPSAALLVSAGAMSLAARRKPRSARR